MSGDYSRFSFKAARNYHGVLQQQGRVLLDQDWNEQSEGTSRNLRALRLDVLGRVFASTPDAFRIESDGCGGLTIGLGRFYVDGLLAENHGAGRLVWDAAMAELRGEQPVFFVEQPYLPAAPELPRSGGPYLAYLDVWQREVTFIEDPELVDSALGTDTTTRLQTVWQVKLIDAASVNAKGPLEQASRFAPSAGRLSTKPGAYTGGENQLYRVEIHDGGAASTATFKWSRDNASTVARMTRLIDPSRIVVQGVRVESAFSAGDWIEITDDPRELSRLPGELRRIKAIDAASSVLTLDAALASGVFPADGSGNLDARRHTRVRRWNGVGPVNTPQGWIELEGGIAVKFDTDPTDGAFRPGDYWDIPARSNDGSIAPLMQAPPRGIHHHFAKLALFTPPDRVRHCRRRASLRRWALAMLLKSRG